MTMVVVLYIPPLCALCCCISTALNPPSSSPVNWRRMAVCPFWIFCCLNLSIQTSVHQRKKHTDRYLNFRFYHPLSHKSAVARTQLGRVVSHSSSRCSVQSEISKLKLINYQIRFLERIVLPSTSSPLLQRQPEFLSTMVLPYLGGSPMP